MDENEKFLVDFGETTVIGGGAVDSVNGYTGNVVLTTSDLENTSDYQNSTQVQNIVNEAVVGKQDTLTAGANITIDDDTISATDTTYSAGTGLNLSGTEFSVDTNAIATKQDITNEATARENADINLQGQIDAISASSDVTDIVGTYAELQAYDTTNLKDNDIIKVLQDESKDGETTYYRWSTTTQTFTLIGEEGPYYTKSATDLLLADKQDKLTAGSNIAIAPDNTISATDTTYTAGTNVQISSGNVISATDTTYSDFVGTDGTSAGTAGLVPAPTTTDAGKFLKADGTWDTAGGVNVVQTTGTSTTDVMSQNAVTGTIFNTPSTTPLGIRIGYSATSSDNGTYGSVAIGRSSNAGVNNAVAIGGGATAGAAGGTIIGTDAHGSTSSGSVGVGVRAAPSGSRAVAIGGTTTASGAQSIALGYYSEATLQGELNIGTGSQTTSGFNSSNYRLIRGVYDGQSAHDAATYGQVISYSALNGAGAPTTATEGKYVGQLYYDTTNEAMYFLKAIDTTTTPATYTWEALGGGGGSTYRVYSDKQTSNSDRGGAIYLGNLDASQVQFSDPSTSDAHRRYFCALPYDNSKRPGNNSVLIGSEQTSNNISNYIGIGFSASCEASNVVNIGGQYGRGNGSVVVGSGASTAESGQIAIGQNAGDSSSYSATGAISIGYGAKATVAGEMNIGTNNTSYGYNNTNYRLISGVHDGQNAHDAATVGQVNSVIDAINTALSTNIPHIGASS